MRFRKLFILRIIIFQLLELTTLIEPAKANHAFWFTLKEIVNKSDVILIGKVSSVERHLYRKKSLTILTAEILKGPVLYSVKIEFTVKNGNFHFIQGENYIFFLYKFNKGYDFVGGIQGYARIHNDNYFLFDEIKVNLSEFKNRFNQFFPPRIVANGKKIFSEDEVRNHVLKYIEKVFGENEPTLEVFYKFEKGEAEYELTLKECERRWGASVTEQTSNISEHEDCQKWIKNRNSESKSLYYSLIRQKVKLTPEEALIKKILKPDKSQYYFRIIVQLKNSDSIIVFWHAPMPIYMNIGFIGIDTVNGQEIHELLQISVPKEYSGPGSDYLERRLLKNSN